MKMLKLSVITLALGLLVGCQGGHQKVEIGEAEGSAGEETVKIIPYEMDREVFTEDMPLLPSAADGENIVFGADRKVYGKIRDEENKSLSKDTELFNGGAQKAGDSIRDLAMAEGTVLGINAKSRGFLIENKEKSDIEDSLYMGDLAEDGKSFIGIRKRFPVKGEIKDGKVSELKNFSLPGVLDPHVPREENLTKIGFMEDVGDQIIVGGQTRDGVSMVHVYREDGTPYMYLGGTWGHMTGCSSGVKLNNRYYITDTSSNILLIYNDVGGEIGLVNIGELYGDQPVFLRSVSTDGEKLYGAFVVRTEDEYYQVFIGEIIFQ